MKPIRILKLAPLLALATAAFALAPSQLAAQGTVVGGANNAAPGGISVVVGGAKNRSFGGGSVVVGGNTNKASGQNSAIVTGFQNTTSAAANFSGIVAGSNNLVSGAASMIGSGNKNTASGLSTIVLGGTDNTCSGQFSVIAGGRNNTLNATESFLFASDISYATAHSGIVYLGDNSRGGTAKDEFFGSDVMACRFDNGLLFYADPTSDLANFQIEPNGTVVTNSPPGVDLFIAKRDGSNRFYIDPNGRVGIGDGVSSVTKALVQITGNVFANNGAGTFFDSSSTPTTAPQLMGAVAKNFSLYATHSIGTGREFIAVSDGRIKRIEGTSDPAADLSTLMGIEITDYSYIDTLTKGPGKQKKVIAQQVESVFPQAVSQSTDVVPDIYKKATFENGWIQLESNLKKGDRVRLIGKTDGDAVHEVLEIRDGAFRTAFEADDKEVFVYGREVSDFRAVDYDAIAMLNVSATQELARKLAEKDAEITKLKADKDAEFADLRAENNALATKLAALEARDTAREDRLARLEQALEDAAGTVAVPVALSVSR